MNFKKEKRIEKKVEKKIGYEAKQDERDLKEIWRRVKKRDFSGNTGLVIKNSIYQLSTQIIAKIGALIFTIILARLLMPELFGLYNLALSTILVFVAFSQLGLSQAIVTFISKELGKKGKKTLSYLIYFGKIKASLVLASAIFLLTLSGFIANNFYQKPIFLALLAGSLYIIFVQAVSFLQYLAQASNSFKGVLQKEIVFQVLRVILVPLIIILSINHSISDEKTLMLVILSLALSLFLTSIFLFFDINKIYFKKYKEKNKKLSKNQKKSVNKFVIATAVLALSGLFFNYIDKIMLGRFVEAEFIGYYTAAFSLVGALIPIVSFSAIVLLPIFSRLKGKRLERGFKKSMKLTLGLSIVLFMIVLLIAPQAISLIYGGEYTLSIGILRILSLLLVILPLTGIYTTYFVSNKKPQTVAKLLIFTTMLNIVLNYLLITYLVRYGDLSAVYGVSTATLISQGVLLVGLILKRKNA